MAYETEELIENLLKFEEEFGHYPTHRDFKNGKITPSKGVYYRAFDNSMKEAIRQAELYKSGELIIEDRKRKQSNETLKKQTRVRCLTCGQCVKNVGEYFDTLPEILSGRFIELLNSDNDSISQDTVFACIYKVFGTENHLMNKKLFLHGYLESYQQKYNQEQGEEN